jgi:uncharacterized protein YebE (UPF0316 family)
MPNLRSKVEVEIVLNVLFIFILRVSGVSLSTVRILLMTRGRKLLSAAFGFFQTLVYAVAIGKVVQDLNNIPNLMSYCLGFSVGTLVGMWLEERIAIGFATIRVISPGRSHQVAEAIRQAGYGATESIAQGKEGIVGTVKTIVRRREVEAVCEIIYQYAPDAFITIEDTQKVEQGYLLVARHER